MNAQLPLPVRPPRLSAARKYAVYALGFGVWLTGAAWLVFHYFLARSGPFGPMPHPLEFWSRAAHGAFAFAALWLFGLMWGVHVPQGWRNLKRRWSGSLTFALFAWLGTSGYLLYYLGDELLLSWMTIFHWAAGLIAPAFFLFHRFSRVKIGTPANRAG